MTDSNDSKNSQSKKGIVIVFIAILLAINAVQFFMNLNKNQTIEVQHQTIKTQELDISDMMTQLDSVETELNYKRAEIIKLGGKVDEMDLLLKQVQKDKEQLKKEKYFALADLEKYKAKVEVLVLQLSLSDSKISQLTSQRDSLFKFNQKLEKKIEQNNDSLRLLAYNQKELESKINVASALRAGPIQINALTDRGKLKEGPVLKSRHIHKLRILFNLLPNDVAQVGGKDVYLRIIEPDGSTLFNTSMGGGLFVFEGKEIPYTLHQNILFENNGQQVGYTYLKGNAFKTGKHTIELYSEGFKIGEGNFIVE